MRDGHEAMKKNRPVSELPRHKSKRTTYCHDDDGDDDTKPLLKPFFHIQIAKTHVACRYQLILPAQFAETLPNTVMPVILTRGRRSWEMTYHGENCTYYKRFDNKWKAFAEDNILKVGDVCVFELFEPIDTTLKLKVRVLRGDFPSALLNKLDGTVDNPLIVD